MAVCVGAGGAGRWGRRGRKDGEYMECEPVGGVEEDVRGMECAGR